MKTLTLHCVCGMERTFTGKDAKDIIRKIDEAGWEDFPDKKGEFGIGHAPAICRECRDLENLDEE